MKGFNKISKFLKGIAAALLLACGMNATLTSCDGGLGIYDDLEECPRGVIMRFMFDYNMEFANSFPSQVDCLTVYLFDSEGRLVERRTETTEVLRDEDWRMLFDIPAGDYQVVAYGGIECDENSFAHTKAVADIKTIDDLDLLINAEHIGDEASRPARPLHDLYHGYLKFVVTEGLTYDRATVKMMRDTNHLRLVLQHIDNTPVDANDFRFEVVDDNVKYDYLNNVLPHSTVTYTPWVKGNSNVGLDPDLDDETTRAVGDPVQVAYAELSMSRLMYKSNFIWTDHKLKTQQGPRLRIISKNDRTVVDIPLNNYLLELKSEYFYKMPDQEFLDRCNHYNLVFFLDHDNVWFRTQIIVDDWSVRIDNIEFE